MAELRNQPKNTATTYTVYLLYRDNILFCVALLWSAKSSLLSLIIYIPLTVRVYLLAMKHWLDCPSASKVTLINIGVKLASTSLDESNFKASYRST